MIRPIVTCHKVKSQTLPIQKICFGATQENCNTIPIEVKKSTNISSGFASAHSFHDFICTFGHPNQSGIRMQIASVSILGSINKSVCCNTLLPKTRVLFGKYIISELNSLGIKKS